jgi:hypothetical protein
MQSIVKATVKSHRGAKRERSHREHRGERNI